MDGDEICIVPGVDVLAVDALCVEAGCSREEWVLRLLVYAVTAANVLQPPAERGSMGERLVVDPTRVSSTMRCRG